ncbi:hypothetical protein Tco_1442249 [Tanacetum coccineum]
MEGKSFEEGLAEMTETLKRLQSTLLFHQTKLKESFRQARQDFSLARRDISLVTKKLHISIKASIKEEVDHEEQFDFLGVQLNQQIPNRTVKARKAKARLFWRKFTVTIDRTRRPKSWAECTKGQATSSSTCLSSLLLADFTLQGKSKTNLGSQNPVAQDFKGAP